MNLGENIRFFRKERGYSSKKLGEKIGVSAQAILQYERGERTPNIDIIKKIANALNVPTLVLTEGENAIVDLFTNITENQLDIPSKTVEGSSKGNLLENAFQSILNSEFIEFESIYDKEESIIKYLISKVDRYNNIEINLNPGEVYEIFNFLILSTDSKVQEILNYREKEKEHFNKFGVPRGMHNKIKEDLNNGE